MGERRQPVATLPLAMEPTDTPIRPAVVPDRQGPVPVGATVGLTATGLQPGSDVSLGWCPTDRFEGGGDSACRGTDGASGDVVRVAADGTLSADLPVPEPTMLFPGVDCSVPGRCGLGLDAGDMWSVMAIAPMTIAP